MSCLRPAHTAVAFLAVCLLAASALAAPLITPVAVPYSSGPAYPGAPSPDPTYAADKAVDGDLNTFCCLVDDTLTGSSPTTIPPYAQAPVTGHMVFDLGASTVVSAAKLISRNSGGVYNPRNVDFFTFADDDPTNNTVVDDIEGDPDILPLALNHTYAGLSNSAAESVSWSAVDKRYVGMRVNTSYESGGTHHNYQIGEMQFQTVDTLDPANPHLVLWLKADEGVQDELGRTPGQAGFSGRVATWLDQSGKGNDVAQATAGSQPAYIAAEPALANQPVVRCDGGDLLAGTLDTDPDTAGVQTLASPFTVIGVTKYTAGTGARGWLGAGQKKVAFGSGVYSTIYPSNSFWAWTPYAQSTYGLEDSLDSLWHIQQYTLPDMTEANWTWLLDGLTAGGAVLTSGDPQQYGPDIFVGYSGAGSEYWNGDLAELLVFDHVLSRDELSEIGF
jgi:hypothetical protein